MYMTNMCPPCSSRIVIYTREFSVVLPGPQTQHPPWREPFSYSLCEVYLFIVFLHV